MEGEKVGNVCWNVGLWVGSKDGVIDGMIVGDEELDKHPSIEIPIPRLTGER